MNRIEKRFQALRSRGEKALILYLTAGDPDLQRTEALIPVLDEAGADILEIGVPFSDPTADGPVIQEAAQRSLRAGTNLAAILDMIARLRRGSDIPIVLFTYYNPVFAYGNERFARQAAAAGVDGLLVVDLPPEEAAELRQFTDPRGLDFITLVAPTTGRDRLKTIVQDATGFLYYISITGVTGAAAPKVEDISREVGKIRKMTKLPIAVGFGISCADQARAIARIADGVVIGSAVVRRIDENRANSDCIQTVCAYVREIKEALS